MTTATVYHTFTIHGTSTLASHSGKPQTTSHRGIKMERVAPSGREWVIQHGGLESPLGQ